MRHLLWDASSLVKRYFPEKGSDMVDEIFGYPSSLSMRITFIGYAETAAILRRKRNLGLLDTATFQQSRLFLEAEVLLNPNFQLLTVTDKDILDGMALTDRHNINSTDAALLAAFLSFEGETRTDCFLVASDKRLIRASEVEGLPALNPETISAADLTALLSE